MVTRPGMVHAPGSVVAVLVAGFPAAVKGVGVKELTAVTAVSLDAVIKGWQGGKVLENGELAARGGVLVKAALEGNK